MRSQDPCHLPAPCSREQRVFPQEPRCCAATNPVTSGDSGTKPRRVAQLVSARYRRSQGAQIIEKLMAELGNTDVDGKRMIHALEAAGLAWIMVNVALFV
jgi:hypothetical protein